MLRHLPVRTEDWSIRIDACWQVTAVQKSWMSPVFKNTEYVYRKKWERQRDTDIRDKGDHCDKFIKKIMKELKKYGTESTSDNLVMEKEEIHFSAVIEGNKKRWKYRGIGGYGERVTAEPSEDKGRKVAGAHVGWHVQEVQRSSLRVREMS